MTSFAYPTDPEQLRLFYTARQLQGIINDSVDLKDDESLTDMWSRKLRESLDEGIFDLMLATGWDKYFNDEPIVIEYDYPYATLCDGHHRIAAAAHLERGGWRNFYISNVEHWDGRSEFSLTDLAPEV